jgi:hypothetical protein
LYTTVGAHVALDVKEVFQQFAPAFQQLIQQAQQRQQAVKGNLPPDAQVVHDTSMAETQRKTQKDQADIQFDQAKLQADMQKHAMDNQTKIDIENAKLTHQTIQHSNELAATPPTGAPQGAAPQGSPQISIPPIPQPVELPATSVAQPQGNENGNI